MIIVTGGTGLLGSHLLYELVQQPGKVVVLKRPSSDLEEVRRVFSYYSSESDQLFERIVWVNLDLLNRVDLVHVLHDADRVYHCAAMVSFQPKDRRQMIDYNVQSTANVVDSCMGAGVKKLVHVSSSSAIGRPPEGTLADETRIWARSKSSSGYAVSKFKSEMEVWRGIEEGLNAVIVNPSIILGPGFWNRGSSSMFRRIYKGLRYATPGVTGYVGVQDVVRSMIHLMNSDISGERFILNSENHSFLEIFRMIRGALWEYGSRPRNRRHFRTISPSALNMLARLDAFTGLITGKRSVTKDQVISAFAEIRFSNEKIRKATGIEFTPIIEVIDAVAAQYVKDQRGY
jgi:nucleoside-diphosphate-sugar epimerase